MTRLCSQQPPLLTAFAETNFRAAFFLYLSAKGVCSLFPNHRNSDTVNMARWHDAKHHGAKHHMTGNERLPELLTEARLSIKKFSINSLTNQRVQTTTT